MVQIMREGDYFTIKFARQDVSEDFLDKLLRRFEVEETLTRNAMHEEEAWQLSEEIKESWWAENGPRVLSLVRSQP